MKTNELRNLTTEELNKKVTECKEELFNLRMQKATGMLEKPSRIHELRKMVASGELKREGSGKSTFYYRLK